MYTINVYAQMNRESYITNDTIHQKDTKTRSENEHDVDKDHFATNTENIESEDAPIPSSGNSASLENYMNNPTSSSSHEKDTLPSNQNGQRNDSLSIFTNFKPTRYSTDASINSFLNISDNANTTTTSGQKRPTLPKISDIPPQQIPDMSMIGRGFSIVNNIWSQQPQPPSMRKQSNDPNDPYSVPKFKTPSFSTSISQQVQDTSSRNDSSLPPSKRNSLYFGSNDCPDLDFLSIANQPQPQSQSQSQSQQDPTRRKSSSVAGMKPPMLIPFSNTNQTSNSNNRQSAGSISSNPNDFDPFFPPGSNTLLLSSRNNSLKFNPEDLDFQFKRRNSSLRNTLDSNSNSNVHFPSTSTDSNNKDINSFNNPLTSIEELDSTNDNNDSLNIPTANKNKVTKPAKKIPKAIKQELSPTERSLFLEEQEQRQQQQQQQPQKIELKPEFNQNIQDNNDIDGNAVDDRPLLGVTKVDQLMLMIQARKKGVTEVVHTTPDGQLLIDSHSNILPPQNELIGGVEKPKTLHEGSKQHKCPYCHRLFAQSTHLEVHIRSHLGYKPYQCGYCGKRFTQGGNLRTHQRLHTGEKPYECELCDKKFSRKGNLAAHLLTHQKVKPFICKLDNCNRSFTQLGNMKAHQNRFHLDTLKMLTTKLAEMNPNDNIPQKDRELLEYFASIYKNSNRGIKGRGKGSAKIQQTSPPITNNSPPRMTPKSKKKSKKQSSPRSRSKSKSSSLPIVPFALENVDTTEQGQQHLQQQQNEGHFDTSLGQEHPIINYHYTTLPQTPVTITNNAANNSLNLTNMTDNSFSFNLDQPVPDATTEQQIQTFPQQQRQQRREPPPHSEKVHFKNVNYKSQLL